jgi:hypothetical protein
MHRANAWCGDVCHAPIVHRLVTSERPACITLMAKAHGRGSRIGLRAGSTERFFKMPGREGKDNAGAEPTWLDTRVLVRDPGQCCIAEVGEVMKVLPPSTSEPAA